MGWLETAAALGLGLTALLVARVPVVFAFLAVTAVAAWALFPGLSGLQLMIRTLPAGLAQFVLVPIPLFLLIGIILFEGGATQRALAVIDTVFRRSPRRHGYVALIAGVVLAAVSGSSIASASVLGRTLVPAVVAAGAAPHRVVPPILASGGLAMMIPPSALAVLLASIAGVPVAALLLAALPVGLVLAAGFLVVIRLLPPSAEVEAEFGAEAEVGAEAGMEEGTERAAPVAPGPALRALAGAIAPLVGVFAVTVGGFAVGATTPTGAAALGVAAALAVVALQGGLSRAVLVRSILECVYLSGALLLLVAAAGAFSQVLVFGGVAAGITGWVSGLADAPVATLAVMVAICLLLGCLLDGISVMLITVPIFLPAAAAAGISPLLLCLAILLAVEIGLLTPPFGLLLMVARGFPGEPLSVGRIFVLTLPFLAVDLAVLGGVVLLAGA